MIDRASCEPCQEPTKRPTGFWDGHDENSNPTNGLLYDCDNTACPTKQAALAEEEEQGRRQAAARAENEKNLIDPKYMKELRRRCRFTIMDAANFLGVQPSTISAYETEREPIPPDQYNKLMAHLLNFRIMQPSEDKYDHIRHLVFFGEKHGFAEDLYKAKENGNILCRQRLDDNLVRWLTTSGRDYEADSPIKDGMTLHIINPKTGETIFTETTFRTEWNGAGQADKAHPFSWEETQE